MQTIAYAAILAVILPASVMTWLAFTGDRAGLRNIQSNLGRRPSSGASTLTANEQLASLSKKAMPQGYAAWLDRQLAGAGRPKDWPLARVIMVKPLLALAGSVLGIVVVTSGPTPPKVLLMVGATALAYFVPDLLIRNYAQKRREAIKLELPNALDQMLISVQAGLGFETAMARAGQNGKGPLADELIRTLQDIQVGRSRKEAYLAMAQRVDVPDLRSFVRAVVQADTYGIAIARVLESQAKDMRVKRRQRAEEHAMKMPVKMLFPLIFFILPTLFIVVLGPTVLSIMEVFANK
ncbi:type II secretion system F family protein [Arthrobacter sp. AL12]|uniref:type II secretion system F family protein n=1 Tax=Arthrobacter sp. AL12 TaxID=3042241 RepID=UPI00249C4029|nr:type II secretion system F family protein [Arthrobacter sp. AL12]MDI3211503.1 type II secretion system F family protein [Arthrobacter sp. AL12]